MQRHAAVDRVPGLDRGRGLPHLATGLVPGDLVVLSALPIAMTANVARVVLTGYIMHFVNPQYASGAYHTVEGMLMMGFGLLLLQFALFAAESVLPDRRDPTSQQDDHRQHPDPCGTGRSERARRLVRR